MIALQVQPPALQDAFPAAGPALETLTNSPISQALQGLIAQIEIPHIVGLFMLAGVSIVVGLRLMGLGLREAPASALWKSLSPWLHLGLFLTLASGVALGLTSALKLYSSVAFLVKIISLAAALILTYGVLAPTAKTEGDAPRGTGVALIAGSLIWFVSLWLFVTQVGVNPGMIHLMMAATLIGLIAFQGRMRWMFAAVLCAIVAIWQLTTHVFVLEGTSQADLDAYFAVNRTFMYLAGGWIFGAVALNILGMGAPLGSTRLRRMVAYASILSWVTVAAAGRWIAFAS